MAAILRYDVWTPDASLWICSGGHQSHKTATYHRDRK